MKHLKKSLKKGQSSFEYLILFCIIAGLALISLSTLLPRVKTSGEEMYQRASDRIANAHYTP